ncbi:hypothetical protein MKW94_001299 [Papaver nudicaule]|uniref:Uncharacterized protein n=1 Tax=Papaver nudicaule TaxID=74823 RepID=A0AA41VQA1_PAPNU|nr:hypothetical protein [Papaver nudicaule]
MENILVDHSETVISLVGNIPVLLEADMAKELFRQFEHPENSCSQIRFSNISFGVGAARVAEPILSSLKQQLTEVHLSTFVTGRSESEAVEVMGILSSALEGCSLKTLSLSHNYLGEKGVRAFGGLLKSQSNLEKLYLMKANITKEAAKAISELIPSTEKLKVLHFDYNRTGDEGAIFIAKIVEGSTSLQDFRCATSWIGSKGGVALVEALGKCCNLQKLNLMDNMFGIEARKPLARALLANAGLTKVCLAECVAAKKSLTKLNLSGNRLKDVGATMIGRALACDHNQLKKVDMSQNGITVEGARNLANAVCDKPNFTLLNINGNCISEEGIVEVKQIFGESLSLLGPLDENDPNGEDESDENDPNGEDDE